VDLDSNSLRDNAHFITKMIRESKSSNSAQVATSLVPAPANPPLRLENKKETSIELDLGMILSI
jgi:hypothetical protein